MADYFAVLQRTLSGFADPKPELRIKLYERARATIERQLQTRIPPIEGEALQVELQKLEQAIIDTERGFQQEGVAAEATFVESEPLEPPEQQPVPAPIPVEEAPPIPINSAPQPVAETVPEPIPAQEPEPIVEPAPVPEMSVQPPQEPEPIVYDSIPVMEPPIEPANVSAASASEPLPAADPVEEWAKEFLSNEPAHSGTVVSEETQPPHIVPQVVETSAPMATPKPSPSPQSVDGLPTFDTAVDDDLNIPPAPGYTARTPKKRKKRGVLRWILWIIVLAAIGYGGYWALNSRDAIVDTLGLQKWFDDPTRPKPVKTITIKPDPIEPEAKVPSTKSETRLSANTSDSGSIKPPIAQNAVLYEIAGNAADNSVDAGRVVWDVAHEEPLAGLPKEPTIRARVEIPSRKLVLILSIKRNGDKSVPASHLMEVVFVVPDDFAGGGVGKINSPIFKEQEKSEGAELVGVPIEVSDGIFMVALDNLDTAVARNTSLMKDKNWIDIPMIYRTGRRAVLSIEKGQPGNQILKRFLLPGTSSKKFSLELITA